MRRQPPAVRQLLALGALAVAAACAVDAPAPPAIPPADAHETLGTRHLQRLSRTEYERTLRELLGDAAVNAAALELSTLPDDANDGAFRSMAHGVSSDHVDAYFRVAERLARHFVEQPSRLADLDTCLDLTELEGTEFADVHIDENCVTGFIQRFGARVLRRPLHPEESARLLDSYRQGEAIDGVGSLGGVELVLLELLLSPPFLYRLELDGDALANRADTFALTNHEIAVRLSYFAWGTAPDAELTRAATAGELTDEARLTAHVDRLFSDERAHAQVRRFFAAWLGYEALPPPSAALAGGVDVPALHASMRRELDRFVDYHLFERGSDYASLLSSGALFVDSAELGDVYGVSPSNRVAGVDDAQRDGLLTRAGMLINSGMNTHPIQRAAFIRRTLLCETLPRPDANQLGVSRLDPPPFDPTRSARERWDALTSGPACAACHERINPVGFVLERYDNLGRFRLLEPVFDADTEQLVAELPIDTNVELLIDGAPTAVADAAELGQRIGNSEQAQRCFAKQWFRFVEGRRESGDDTPMLDRMREHDGGLIDTMKRIALAPEFKLRRIAVEVTP